MCKQACEYRHETHKLAPPPDEYASAGIVASVLFTIPTYGQGRGKQTDEPSGLSIDGGQSAKIK